MQHLFIDCFFHSLCSVFWWSYFNVVQLTCISHYGYCLSVMFNVFSIPSNVDIFFFVLLRSFIIFSFSFKFIWSAWNLFFLWYKSEAHFHLFLQILPRIAYRFLKKNDNFTSFQCLCFESFIWSCLAATLNRSDTDTCHIPNLLVESIQSFDIKYDVKFEVFLRYTLKLKKVPSVLNV